MKTPTSTIVLTLLLSSAVPSLAHAQKWVKTYGTETGVEYADMESVKRVGRTATANFKREYIDQVIRKSNDEAGKSFQFNQSRSVKTFHCDDNRSSIDEVWEVSIDKKSRSPSQSYPISNNNDTWDAAAKAVVCK